MANIAHGYFRLPSGKTVELPYDPNFNFNNIDPMPGDIDPYTVGTTQLFPLGTKLVQNDRTFRYAEYGGTTAAGNVVQREGPDGAHDDLDPTGSGTGAGVAVGDTIISIATSITLVVNEYVGGTLTVEEDTGQGYSYLITANEVAAGAANANVTIADGLAVAIDATSDVKLVKSAYREVIIAPTTLTGAICGVGVGVGADGSYGWIQTTGDAAIDTDGTVVIGQRVMASNGTAGFVEAMALTEATPNTFITPDIGTVVDVGATGVHSVVRLNGFE